MEARTSFTRITFSKESVRHVPYSLVCISQWLPHLLTSQWLPHLLTLQWLPHLATPPQHCV